MTSIFLRLKGCIMSAFLHKKTASGWWAKFSKGALRAQNQEVFGEGARLISSYALIKIGVTKTLGLEHHMSIISTRPVHSPTYRL